MDISPIDRVYAKIRMKIYDVDGRVVAPAAVDAAILPYRTDPDATTTWATFSYTAYAQPDKDGYTGQIEPLIAGPAADPTGAVTVPIGGASLWIRVTDSPEVQAVPAGSVNVR